MWSRERRDGGATRHLERRLGSTKVCSGMDFSNGGLSMVAADTQELSMPTDKNG